jgi:hypothetical protein
MRKRNVYQMIDMFVIAASDILRNLITKCEEYNSRIEKYKKVTKNKDINKQNKANIKTVKKKKKKYLDRLIEQLKELIEYTNDTLVTFSRKYGVVVPQINIDNQDETFNPKDKEFSDDMTFKQLMKYSEAKLRSLCIEKDLTYKHKSYSYDRMNGRPTEKWVETKVRDVGFLNKKILANLLLGTKHNKEGSLNYDPDDPDGDKERKVREERRAIARARRMARRQEMGLSNDQEYDGWDSDDTVATNTTNGDQNDSDVDSD